MGVVSDKLTAQLGAGAHTTVGTGVFPLMAVDANENPYGCGFDEAIMLTPDGHVSEGSGLFLLPRCD